jgi:hypothetical protein
MTRLTLVLCSFALTLVAQEGRFERTLNVGGPTQVRLHADTGELRVTAGAAGEVKVTARIRKGSWNYDNGEAAIREIETNPPIERQGDVIRIGFLPSRLEKLVKIDYEVTVPAETALETDTDTGNQTITGLTRPVRAKADTGRIMVERCSAGLTAETDTGRIEAINVAAPLELKADTGKIRAEVSKAGPVTITTDTGDIELRLPAGAGFDLKATNDTGRLRVEMPVTARGAQSKHHVQGAIGGGGPLVKLTADTGSITVR